MAEVRQLHLVSKTKQGQPCSALVWEATKEVQGCEFDSIIDNLTSFSFRFWKHYGVSITQTQVDVNYHNQDRGVKKKQTQAHEEVSL